MLNFSFIYLVCIFIFLSVGYYYAFYFFYNLLYKLISNKLFTELLKTNKKNLT